ncbi:unnamed protein product [Candidula unifasciata]|uniref:Tumor protein p53-inducible nuclear protein 1 n=1 Tax=Candidula unifasciata TaxID=100452 RepID=A0A8S3ZSS6_9EUPU|nr:unnamed protein product [Candidula unifasciata]
MFNSVAKYLWGSNSEHGQEYTDSGKLKQQHGTGEHLDVQQEEDWLVVNADDKENSGQPGQRHQQIHHHHRGYAHHTQQGHSGQDSLSQNSSNASDTEFLDDAAALAAQSISMDDLCHPTSDMDAYSEYILSPLHDCGRVNQDTDRYSDTESLPESVFSACSGRSHATYHPCGSRSEPWVVAPPPCFTGSQVGGLSPVASSPLENLLIEHPSMSVYLSFPPSLPFLSSHPLGQTFTNSLREDTETVEGNEDQVLSDQISNRGNHNEARSHAIQQPNTQFHAAANQGLLSPQQLLKDIHVAQRLQCIQVKKLISKSKCERQNKVREYQSHAKGSNGRNKRMRPSGFKASRFGQHM